MLLTERIIVHVTDPRMFGSRLFTEGKHDEQRAKLKTVIIARLDI